MSATPLHPSRSEAQSTIERPLANGSLVTYIRVSDPNYALRYDVRVNGAPSGYLVLLVVPVSEQRLWLASPNGLTWYPPVYSQREAARFLLPLQPVC